MSPEPYRLISPFLVPHDDYLGCQLDWIGTQLQPKALGIPVRDSQSDYLKQEDPP